MSEKSESDWLRQQERSNLAILKLMVWISLTFGRAIGRVVLYGIAGYFVLFSPRARRFSRDYLHLALNRWAEWSDGFRHVFSFASTIHDRIYLLNDRFDLFEIEVHGAEALHAALIVSICSTSTSSVPKRSRNPPKIIPAPFCSGPISAVSRCCVPWVGAGEG